MAKLTEAINPQDPLTILAGIEQFGLAADGSDLRDLRAALTAALGAQTPPEGAVTDAQGWRDIASAPKDGRRLLLWAEQWTAPCTGQYYGEPRGWGAFYDVGMYKYQPTHWMPLPAAPPTPGGLIDEPDTDAMARA